MSNVGPELLEPELRNDVRWQLIERIIASNSLHRSERLSDLLRYLAKRALCDDTDSPSEHQIGVAVFGRPENYSIVEDSSVRVHMRQLRLKLHEYFDSEGQQETYIVDIPKGSYRAVFRPLKQKAHPPEPEIGFGRFAMRLLPWALAILFLITTLIASSHRVTSPPDPTPPWPLSVLFDNGNQTVRIVVADVNYGLVRLLSGRDLTLQQYLSPAYRSGKVIADVDLGRRKDLIVNYLSGSVLTSYADAKVSILFAQISGEARNRLVVRSAPSLTPHDFDQGNFVLVGGPASNPWVSYFQDKLNFRARPVNATGHDDACFDNLQPKPGEQKSYCGSLLTGGAGVGYATISLLPLPSGRGSVLILQGLHQEGTEAAGDFLADASSRRLLQTSLGISNPSARPVYFEALICSQSIAGTPVGAPYVVAVRRLNP